MQDYSTWALEALREEIRQIRAEVDAAQSAEAMWAAVTRHRAITEELYRRIKQMEQPYAA